LGDRFFILHKERNNKMLDVAIIGCGITGAAAAYELSKYQLRTAVFENANDVAEGSTKANSAILHAGYDPKPGTLMAQTNVEGVRLAEKICRDLDVPYKKTGSLVVAFSKDDLPTLEKLFRRGLKNGVPGLEILNAKQTLKMEPGLSEKAAGALYAPTAAVVNPWEYALAMAETAALNGVTIHLRCGVLGIQKTKDGFALNTPKGIYEARTVLNAAGLFADTVHEMVGEKEFTITPNKGEYYILDKEEGDRVSHVVFQCPSEKGKGVLVSPTVHGVLIVGPNAQIAKNKDDLSSTAQGLGFVAEKARLSVPGIDFSKSIRNFSGLRAAPDTGDFIVSESRTAKGFINLAGIKSPGLSAAPAVAKMAVELLKQAGLSFMLKEGFIGKRKIVRIAQMTGDEINELIAANPAYGRVVCRCETVSEGEVLDALSRPIPPRTLDAVKRRCGAGLGRCQSGFCGPRVLEILSRELGLPPEKVFLDREGSFIVLGDNRPENGKECLKNV
jgi:glycerol-3-phosphate dehydrogenase